MHPRKQPARGEDFPGHAALEVVTGSRHRHQVRPDCRLRPTEDVAAIFDPLDHLSAALGILESKQ